MRSVLFSFVWGIKEGMRIFITFSNAEGIIYTRIEAEQIAQLRLLGLMHAQFL